MTAIALQNIMTNHACPHPVPLLTILLGATALTACAATPWPGTLAPRKGDEIVVAGQFVHTGTRVVLWMDPQGYDAYRVERRFSPIDKSDWETSRAEIKDLTMPNRITCAPAA